MCPLSPREVGSSSPAESLQALIQQEEPQQTKGGRKGSRNGAFSQPRPWVCCTSSPFTISAHNSVKMQFPASPFPLNSAHRDVAVASLGCRGTRCGAPWPTRVMTIYIEYTEPIRAHFWCRCICKSSRGQPGSITWET